MSAVSLKARRLPLADPAHQQEQLDDVADVTAFGDSLQEHGLAPLRSGGISVLQVNVGKLCNQTCRHCHVDAGPDRKESMSKETFEHCLRALDQSDIHTVDLTGGAPELNPHFRWFVSEIRRRDVHVIDRCNLTILETPTHRDLPEFFREHQVEVVCSLPHYQKLSTDRQRGDGVYQKSIRALKRLNEVGYGDGQSGLELVLVTNPVGAFLPPDQGSIEKEWKRELFRNHGIVFDRLYTITNMPISRYLEWLIQTENLDTYLQKLLSSFNPATVDSLMCRSMVSVGWDGALFDCDFNQMLEIPLEEGVPRHIRDFRTESLVDREIRTAKHCYGCTAGAGSSCGGDLVSAT